MGDNYHYLPKHFRLPLSLYIHFPWCIRKCPYCDFVSYSKSDAINAIGEDEYINALIMDLTNDLQLYMDETGENDLAELTSIYIGGGTPSLMSIKALDKLLAKINSLCKLSDDIEITIEANPGTITAEYCRDLRVHCGINRISIGVQSFQNDKLKAIGRIHDAVTARRSVEMARNAGFDNINLDLMFGLPLQSVDDAINDLNIAISLNPTHISWYQFTIEPNTIFSKVSLSELQLPHEEQIWRMQNVGQKLLNDAGFKQYEVSAYSKIGYQCRHNLNYWQFGDYLGIGAAAHSKLTFASMPSSSLSHYKIIRQAKTSSPKDYCDYFSGKDRKGSNQLPIEKKLIEPKNLPFEFMLNALRLYQPIPYHLFTERTGLDLKVIEKQLEKAANLDLIELGSDSIITTDKGKNFLNDLLEIFMV